MKQKNLLKRAVVMTAAAIGLACSTASAEPLLNPTFNTLFKPLLADPTEPRIAVMPMISEDGLQLDIGTSADIYQNSCKTFAVGVDFGTFSRLNTSGNFKFPVDTIDYLFGINATWKTPLDSDSLPFDELSARLRLSHISAHFEDGHTDDDGQWIQSGPFEIPFTYSREFLNLTLALSTPEHHRIYAGYQYLWHSIPDNINPHSFQLGAEIATPGNTYLAADFKLLPIWRGGEDGETKGYRGTWNLQAGMRLTALGMDRVRVAYNYFSGMSRHGMYFYQPESYSTIGMIVDL
ncbi:DUF1207 domain-containing protein [Chlorobium sp.]|jgi:hypothetical protein|uniref:DUF1207 domain-containing protein n=1 Tax=Chlorobium sp. TaxID=1095 RepID=UPI003C4EA547|nr:DUF1207 domain-containing protein [Chlorobiaceae bacterium]NTW94673.1 DUF1207 domain-containing protein [Chlorobiaceae bacterium]